MADLIDRNALEPFYESGTDPNDTYADMTFIRSEHIEHAPAVNRWISVEDALPEKDKSYITYAETTKYCTHNELPEESRINVLYFNGEEWYDGECRYYNVTHYMPLPEPPESEVHDD